jgi:hypothetical protein
MDKTIYIVPIEFLHHAWAFAEKFIKEAMQYAQGDYNIEQAKVYLVQNSQHLILFLENAEVVGATIFSVSINPNDKVFYIQATGGKTTKEHMNKMFDYAKEIGCTKVKASCRKSVARLCRQRYNFKETYTMIERAL